MTGRLHGIQTVGQDGAEDRHELPVGLADGAFNEDGTLADRELIERYRDLLGDLVREVTAPIEA